MAFLFWTCGSAVYTRHMAEETCLSLLCPKQTNTGGAGPSKASFRCYRLTAKPSTHGPWTSVSKHNSLSCTQQTGELAVFTLILAGRLGPGAHCRLLVSHRSGTQPKKRSNFKVHFLLRAGGYCVISSQKHCNAINKDLSAKGEVEQSGPRGLRCRLWINIGEEKRRL